MTETPTTEPETAKPPDQPRPFQFTIGSLMILTAVVAGFFALATQAPVVITVIVSVAFIHISLLALALIYRTRWKGITAINITVFNCFSLPVAFASLHSFLYYIHYIDEIVVPALCFVSSLFSLGFLLFLIVPLSSRERFNKFSGKVCLIIHGVWIAYLILIFVMWFFITRNLP